jgi:hypothetical protein
MSNKAKVSPAIFAVSILCFFMPFVAVSCNGQRVATFTAAQLATGTTLEQPQMLGGPQKRKVNAEPLAAVAGLCAVLGLCFSFLPGTRSAVAPALCGFVGVVALLLLKSKLDADILKSGGGAFQLEYGAGFTLALLLFIAGAGWNMYALTRAGRAAPPLPPASPPTGTEAVNVAAAPHDNA